MSYRTEIAGRVAASIPAGTSYAELAAAVRMTTEQLAKLLTGDRDFSSVDIALLGDALGVDEYWLISGEPGPPERKCVLPPPLTDEKRELLSKPMGIEELAAVFDVELDEFDRTEDTKPAGEA
jgi:hypothetical protein